MSPDKQNIPQLDGVLADATDQIRETPVSDDLVARCRAKALEMEGQNLNESPKQPASWIEHWGTSLAVAASIVVAINIAQYFALRPPSDRQVTAVLLQPDGQRRVLYSDRIIEPALDSAFSNQGESK